MRSSMSWRHLSDSRAQSWRVGVRPLAGLDDLTTAAGRVRDWGAAKHHGPTTASPVAGSALG